MAVQRVVREESSALRAALAARSSRAQATQGGEQPADGASAPGGEQPADGTSAPGREQLPAAATVLARRLGPAITGGPGF